MNYSNLMEAVNARIKANGRREITGDILNDVLRAMVVELGAGYQLGGTIRPGDKPKGEDLRVAYLAVEPGVYLYAGGFEVTELSLITYGAEWYMYPLGVPFGSQIAEDIAAAVDAEKTRAMAAEKALNDAIAAEASARKAADNALTTKIETEVSDRKAADQALQGNINAEKTRAMAAEKALNDAIATETRERAAADSTLDSAIKAETKRATDAEGVLTKAVEDEKARAMAAEGANTSAITAEADARAKADTTLQGNITAEATAREAADASLQSNIDKKVSEDDATWLKNFMPRIQLKGDGTVGAVTYGDGISADYLTTSTRLGRYGGVVTGFDDESVLGRVVQVKILDGSRLSITAIFNNGDFGRDSDYLLYDILLIFDPDGTFGVGTYTVNTLGKVFTLHLNGGQFQETPEEVGEVITNKSTIFRLEEDFGNGVKRTYSLIEADYSVGGTLCFGTYSVEDFSIERYDVYTEDMTYDHFEDRFASTNWLEDPYSVILYYNGLDIIKAPLFCTVDGTPLTNAQVYKILKDRTANQVVLKNKASSVMQTSAAKFLQCDGSVFIIGFDGANASGQIFDILFRGGTSNSTVLRAELLYNPTA